MPGVLAVPPSVGATYAGFVGIDPGTGGYIVRVARDGTIVFAHRMPVVIARKGTARKNYDKAALWGIIQSVRGCCVVLERQSTRPGQGAWGAFMVGRGYGLLEGMLTAAGVSTFPTTPQSWKAEMGVRYGGEGVSQGERRKVLKDLAIAEAIRLFPGYDFRDVSASARSKKLSSDHAEAALMARYALHKYGC